MEFRRTYSHPDFLQNLVNFVTEDDCKLSVRIRPDILPDSSVAKGLRTQHNLAQLITMATEQQFNTEELHKIEKLLSSITLLEEQGILPFWELEFDYGFSQNAAPRIRYVRPEDINNNRSGYEFMELVNAYCQESWRFIPTQGKVSRWNEIRIKEATGENTQAAKVSVNQSLREGYHILHVSAQLHPHWAGSGYTECIEADAELYASHGEVVIYLNKERGSEPQNPEQFMEAIMRLDRQEDTIHQPTLPWT